ncbi:MAG: hypothetical protein ACOYO1_18090 [Bacteroidales bacterium]
MNKSIILENISRQLELINEQNSSIKAYAGKIPQIDMDILKANIRKLYEQYCDLEKTNTNQTVEPGIEKVDGTHAVINEIKETIERPLVIVHEKQIKEEKPVIIKKPETMVVDENIEVIFAPEPKAIVEEKALEIREETTITEKTVETEKIETLTVDTHKVEIQHEEPLEIETYPVEVPTPELSSVEIPKAEAPIDLFGNTTATTIADRYKDDTKSINEKILKTKIDKSISTRMQHHAIKDLKSAIGINEKFLFINELFKGNMKEYNESILKLNDFKSQAEAEHFLGELKTKHKWEDDLVAFLTLKDFVDRKHI